MTPTPQEAMRQEFEAWAAEKWPDMSLARRRDESYWDTGPDAPWEAWQAALRAQPEAQPDFNLSEERRKARQQGYFEGMSAGTARGLAALLRRGLKQLDEWQRKYGEHQPQWLPPAGDVRWAEDVAEALSVPGRAQPEAAAQPAQPVAESWWLMESTVTPRPLFYAGHNKHSDGALKPTVTENAAQAVRFPDEWTAKYTLAHLLGIDVSGPRWTFAFMNSGYAVREHIFDYTPRALASPPPAPKTGDGSAIEGGDSTHGGEQ